MGNTLLRLWWLLELPIAVLQKSVRVLEVMELLHLSPLLDYPRIFQFAVVPRNSVASPSTSDGVNIPCLSFVGFFLYI